jgi:hypothetical protein
VDQHITHERIVELRINTRILWEVEINLYISNVVRILTQLIGTIMIYAA